MSAQPVNVLAVMLADALAAEDWRVLKTGDRNAASARKFSDEARAAVAELVDCVGDAQSLLAEIDKAVRAEHTKNGAPKSQSVAGIINARLTAALARVQGGAA